MKPVLRLVVASFLIFCVQPGGAAPKAQDGEECYMAADMLLSARAMAESGVPEKTIRAALARMYTREHVAKWADDLVKHALRSTSSAKDATGELLRQCVERRGNVDGLLGVAL